MASSERLLFHITPTRNIASIIRSGLLPRRSKGADLRVWLCSEWRIPWAFTHLAAHHNCDKLTCLAVLPSGLLLRRKREGIFTTADRILTEYLRVDLGRTKQGREFLASCAS
jgi:hypothetical protein